MAPTHPRGPARVLAVARRVVLGVYEDGFIHAGNLAYMAILALFPFFIVVAGVFSAVGEEAERAASVHAFMAALPPVVSSVLEPVAMGAMNARHGWLLWAGSAVGLWTVSGLIETIRDILRRAYGARAGQAPWWRHRLFATAMIMVTVILLMASLFAQVLLETAVEVVRAWFSGLPGLLLMLRLSRLLPVMVLFGAIYMLFLALTPPPWRRGPDPKWPGALLVTVWWGVVTEALPVLLHSVFKYDLTYGSLAGVMIALFFFWLVGLGMVTGAELNAALASNTPRADRIGPDVTDNIRDTSE